MESTKYLLVGGGVASLAAATAIRERDKEGRIVIIGSESHPPYDRPPLSKQMLVNDDMKSDDPYSKFDNYYPDNGIELMKGKTVVNLDRQEKTAALAGGAQVRYEKALLATGSHIRKLEIPGADLPDVFYLRYIENAEGIRAGLNRSRRAVVVGSSYMGIEAASGCVSKGVETAIVDSNARPWSKFSSPELGDFVRKQFEEKGARFILGSQAAGIVKQGDYVQVHTEAGLGAEGNIAIACVGHQQNLAVPSQAGLEMDEDGVVTDSTLQTSDPSIWAAGDIASLDDKGIGRRWHAEHFLHARWTGERAGANMAGDVASYDKIPYFFSDFLDLHMILRGDPKGTKAAGLLGSMSDCEFVELYGDAEGILRMAVGVSRSEKRLDPWTDRLDELIRARTPVGSIKAGEFGI